MALRSLIPWRKSAAPVRHSFEQMFDELFNDPWNFGLRPFEGFEPALMAFSPKLDVSENETEIKVVAELPGLNENEVNISLANNILTLSGEKKAEKEDKGENYYQIERSYGSFRRSVALPAEVDADKVEATYKNGLLTISLPKSPQTQSKKIEVKAS